MLHVQKIVSILLISFLFSACSKEEEEVKVYEPGSFQTVNTGSTGGGSNVNSCTSIVTSGTILHNNVTYKINALSGSGNTSVGIEWVNLSGDPFPSNYSMEFIQVVNGNTCHQSSSSSELTSTFGKFFQFSNLPTWSNNTSVVVKVHIKLDGVSYFLEDLHLNQ